MRRLMVAVAGVALVASACGGGGKDSGSAASPSATFEAGSTMAAIQKAGSLRVGVKYDVPQFGQLDPASGKPEGFDVDMGAAIAKALGVQVAYSEAVSANRIPFLNEDKVDIVFSTMTINDERKQQIDFTDVYYVAGQKFLYKKGKPVTIDTAGGKKVCTAKGSTSEKNLSQLAPKAEVILQDGYAQCFQLLQNDQADAMTTDDVILLGFLKQDKESFEMSKEAFSKEPYGGGIKKGRDDLVQFVNGVIQTMKKDGRWEAIYKKWITPLTGETPEPPPADVKAEVGKG